MSKTHRYEAEIVWTGNQGTGTSSYKAYSRDHVIRAAGKPDIAGSSDPAFRGDPARYNPEDMLVASLSACHMLWYLHLCAANKIVVQEYRDPAIGVMIETADGSGHFESVTLRPRITIAAGGDVELAKRLHEEAHAKCFIANSVNFPVRHEAEITVAA
ncbi:MAG TPA: OsmC family protein [Ferrovibrio sp.]|uniref:OsmC family protein n=1 Tax=Ferrovibrio sp. TaxID=1917215 RepID=UPI002ED18599